MTQHHKRVRAEISLPAIQRNWRELCRPLDRSVRRCAVIKANGYGHGALPIGHRLEPEADFFAVATAAEAMDLCDGGIGKPILILGYTWEEEWETLIDRGIRLTVFRESDAALLSKRAAAMNRKAIIHVKLDTGMGRIGFPCTESSVDAIERIVGLPGLIAEGIFTHLARADESDKTSAQEQLARFDRMLCSLKERGITFPLRHAANSAAAMELPQAAYDMVRIGIALYGLYPSEEVARTISLVPALSLRSSLVHVKDVPAGSGISYGHIRVLAKDTRVATVPVGYADGYPRLLSNKGYVLVRGQRAPILGRICMDQMMIDVTGIEGAAQGDTVTLIGEDGGASLPVEELSALCGVFNYEFVCGISPRVPRIYMTR